MYARGLQRSNNTVITARSMDFTLDIRTNSWMFTRGIKRTGETGENTISWVSQYGSVSTSSWDIAVSDGINEKGLVANMLWLDSSEYPEFSKEGKTKKGLAVSLWAQYALDNFETVAERSEEHTSELQSRGHLVCRLLLEKKTDLLK